MAVAASSVAETCAAARRAGRVLAALDTAGEGPGVACHR